MSYLDELFGLFKHTVQMALSSRVMSGIRGGTIGEMFDLAGRQRQGFASQSALHSSDSQGRVAQTAKPSTKVIMIS